MKLAEVFSANMQELVRLHEICARGNVARADNGLQSGVRELPELRGARFVVASNAPCPLQFRDGSEFTMSAHFPPSVCTLVRRAIDPGPKVDARKVTGMNRRPGSSQYRRAA